MRSPVGRHGTPHRIRGLSNCCRCLPDTEARQGFREDTAAHEEAAGEASCHCRLADGDWKWFGSIWSHERSAGARVGLRRYGRA
eukprot:7387038-Prymnesium_polylepis.1